MKKYGGYFKTSDRAKRWSCDKCGDKFDDFHECTKHEAKCKGESHA